MTSLAGQERRSFYRKREAAEDEALVSPASRESSRAFPVQCYFYLLFKKNAKEKKARWRLMMMTTDPIRTKLINFCYLSGKNESGALTEN